MTRGAFLDELFDDAGQLKPEELQRLTPGTVEFAVLDATTRRDRQANPNHTTFERINSSYRSAPERRLQETQDHTLPAFDARALRSIRSLLQSSASTREFVLDDDMSVEQLLSLYMALRNAAMNEPAPLPETPHFPLLSNFDDEDEMYNRFARIYAARGIGMRPEDVGITRRGERSPDDRMMVYGEQASRAFSNREINDISRAWSSLGSDLKVSQDDSTITCDLSPAQSVTITAQAIHFTGVAADEAMRLSVMHARDHWNGSLAITGEDEQFVLRTMAFASLLGVEVSSHAVEEHQQEAFQRTVDAIVGNYPAGFFGARGRRAPARPSARPSRSGVPLTL